MRRILTGTVIAVVCAAAALAQTSQPKVKSQKEGQAIQAAFGATDGKAKIAAIDEVLTKYADTESKPLLLSMGAQVYRQMGDSENMVVWAERALEADPKNPDTLNLLGNAYASRTKEFDLDKEDKLAKAEGYAKKALEEIKTAQRPWYVQEPQWPEVKAQMTAEAHSVLGTSALVRKKYDVAITEFKAAMEASNPPDPATLVRLASAYIDGGKPDEALPLLEKVLATADAHPQVKSVAQAQRVRATQLKNKNAAPAAAKPAPTAPSPEPVK